MSDIFISYANEDRPRVKPLVDALAQRGWSVWWDRSILPGKRFEEVIDRALAEARCVIVLWSRASIQSDWVRAEADEARQRGILVPALLDDVKIPLAFRGIQAAKLVDWQGLLPNPEFGELSRAVTEILGAEVRPASPGQAVLSEAADRPKEPLRPEAANQRDRPERLLKPSRAIALVGAFVLASSAGLGWYIVAGHTGRKPVTMNPIASPGQSQKAVESKPLLTTADGTSSPTPDRAPGNSKDVLGVSSGHTGRKSVTMGSTASPGQPQTAVESKPPLTTADTASSPTPDKAAAKSEDVLGVSGKYVLIHAGTFLMGCSQGDTECDSNEKPPHKVTLTHDFYMGETDVTVAAYRRFVMETRSITEKNLAAQRDPDPVVLVSWYDATGYCKWDGNRRLPTEAEWEYAARAGTSQSRYGNLDDIAWYAWNSGGLRQQVKRKLPNGFGLYDMLGNVWQWTRDRYVDQYYEKSPVENPPGPSSPGAARSLRGNSWSNAPGDVRVSARTGRNAGVYYAEVGFRCVGEVP
jgi:formylglycine-generating enzyme required for sulfatase activity